MAFLPTVLDSVHGVSSFFSLFPTNFQQPVAPAKCLRHVVLGF
jgi:hypothetical protein